MNALPLVQVDQALGAGHAGHRVKTQPCIHFGGDPPRNDRQNLAAKTHQQAVHQLIERPPPELRHGVRQQRAVIGFLHCLEDQRRVGGGIRGLVGFNLFEVAGVGHHGGELFEGIELVHAAIIRRAQARA